MEIIQALFNCCLALLCLQSMRMQTEMELKMFKQKECVYNATRDAALMKQPMISSF